MVTIKDVANAAGVSTATVSRVINNSSKVPKDTTERIKKIIKEIGYNVSNNKRLGVNKQQQILGLLVSSISSPFGGLLASGIEKVACKKGLKSIIMNSNYDAEVEEENLKYLLKIGCKNIVIHCKSMSDELIVKYTRNEPGIVIVNRKIDSIIDRCIWIDNEEGGYLITNHLLRAGHTNIALLTVDIDISDKTDRYKGYIRALSEYGIQPKQDWIEEVAYDETSIINGVNNLVNKTPGISAIVTYNDYFAAIVMQTFKERGFSIPQDISVVGFDNVLPQCYFTPKLTTIHFPIERMAMNAAILSIDGAHSAIDKCFTPILIKRDSVSVINTV